jgi:hypothetical protein
MPIATRPKLAWLYCVADQRGTFRQKNKSAASMPHRRNVNSPGGIGMKKHSWVPSYMGRGARLFLSLVHGPRHLLPVAFWYRQGRWFYKVCRYQYVISVSNSINTSVDSDLFNIRYDPGAFFRPYKLFRNAAITARSGMIFGAEGAAHDS